MKANQPKKNIGKTEAVSLRLEPAQLATIDENARVAGMCRSEYLLACATRLRRPRAREYEVTLRHLTGLTHRLGRDARLPPEARDELQRELAAISRCLIDERSAAGEPVEGEA